ncbi:TerB family tellurite resistance protein [bacterium]|nr:TerB family tellurite resistance protein [bacterium]
MVIATQPCQPKSPPGPQAPKKEESFWKEFDTDVREFLLHADPHKLKQFGDLVKNLGSGARGLWQLIDPQSVVQNDPTYADLSDKIGLGAGLTAAGGQAILGFTKLARGFKAGHTGKKLDGLVDLGAASTLALTSLALGTARLVAAPITATLNATRGGFNVVNGFKQNDEHRQIQGLLDISRSLGGFSRSFKHFSPLFQVAGIVLAPVAGLLQGGRGIHDLSIGIKNQDKKRMIRGLADMATAVGTTMAFASGVAVIPGVVLAVAANVLKGAYQVSPKFRGFVDTKLDRHQRGLQKLVHTADRLSKPLVRTWHKLLDKILPGDDSWQTPSHYSQAQISEMLALLQVDREYTEEERELFKQALEETGQAAQTPPLNSAPAPAQRKELLLELDSPKKRRDFLHLMVSVADYDTHTTDEERNYLTVLSGDLGISPEELNTMLEQDHPRL